MVTIQDSIGCIDSQKGGLIAFDSACNKGNCQNLHLPQILPTNPCKRFMGLYQQISTGQTYNLQPSIINCLLLQVSFLSKYLIHPLDSPRTLDPVHPHPAESVFTSSKTSLKRRSSPLFRRQWKRAACHPPGGSRTADMEVELFYPMVEPATRWQCYYKYWVPFLTFTLWNKCAKNIQRLRFFLYFISIHIHIPPNYKLEKTFSHSKWIVNQTSWGKKSFLEKK